jgi:hypothetical protein
MSQESTSPTSRSFVLEYEGQRMAVKYTREKFGAGEDYAVDHFQFRSLEDPPRRIPVSETGYRSHFVSSAEVAGSGDLEAFARAIVVAIVRGDAAPDDDDAQASLF